MSTLFPFWARTRWCRASVLLIAAAALAVYLVPRLLASRAQWPMWDVDVYWWGGRQALHDATLYAAHEPRSFTYPPFAAAVFGLAGGVPEIVLKVSMVVLSLTGLVLLAWLSVREAGWRPAAGAGPSRSPRWPCSPSRWPTRCTWARST